MPQTKPSVLQVSSSDSGGGAELVAKQLLVGFRERGLSSQLLVGSKQQEDSNVIEINNDIYRSFWFRFWQKNITKYDSISVRLPGVGRLLRVLRSLGQLSLQYRKYKGYEEFDFPGSRVQLNQLSSAYDIIHVHNLHGGYFDLRLLSSLSNEKVLVISLHDAWLFSGHCAFSISCDRWLTGCGKCPDLSLFPSVNKDVTDKNWLNKKKCFDGSKVYLISPSEWLMGQAKNSLLKDAIVDSIVIPNGVDTSVFYPRDNASIRKSMGLPIDAMILMVAASGLRENKWKDFTTLRSALARLNSEYRIIMLAVGDVGEDELIGQVELRYIEYQINHNTLAEFYSIADIYIQSSIVEVFGNVMLEARACGTPVVSTAVGGIKEHLNSVDWPSLPSDVVINRDVLADGVLCNPGSAKDFSDAIHLLMDDESLRQQLSINSVLNMQNNFELNLQLDRTVNWYKKILAAPKMSMK